MTIAVVIYILILVIVGLIGYSVLQIKLAGLNVKDFWSFIEANETLDKLYKCSKHYDKMTPQEQVIFLKEAEKMFEAFEKVPNMYWEEEYQKYTEVLNYYREIRLLRWATN